MILCTYVFSLHYDLCIFIFILNLYLNNFLNREKAWVNWRKYFSLSPSSANDFDDGKYMTAAKGFNWLCLVFFHIDPLLFSRWFVYFFLLYALSLAGHPEVCFVFWEKRQMKCHGFPQNIQILCRVGKMQRQVSGVCRIRHLPYLPLLTWLVPVTLFSE